MAAKHPPDRNGGKASASEETPTTKCDLDDADEMKRRQAQKQELSEESKRRRPPPERRGGTRGKDDTFNKVSGAQGHRRHQPANGSMAFTSTQMKGPCLVLVIE